VLSGAADEHEEGQREEDPITKDGEGEISGEPQVDVRKIKEGADQQVRKNADGKGGLHSGSRGTLFRKAA
jgi:hypothetical protein